MRKADLVEELQEWGIDGWSTNDTVVELRALVSAMRKTNQPEKDVLTGISKKKLADLQQLHEELGLGPPGKLNRGLLIHAIKQHVKEQPPASIPPTTSNPPHGTNTERSTSTSEKRIPRSKSRPSKGPMTTKTSASIRTEKDASSSTTPLKDTKKMATINKIKEETYPSQEERMISFGKHKGKTFEKVIEDDLAYCNWVLETAAMEPSSGKELRTFANYLQLVGLGDNPPTIPEGAEHFSMTTSSEEEEWAQPTPP